MQSFLKFVIIFLLMWEIFSEEGWIMMMTTPSNLVNSSCSFRYDIQALHHNATSLIVSYLLLHHKIGIQTITIHRQQVKGREDWRTSTSAGSHGWVVGKSGGNFLYEGVTWARGGSLLSRDFFDKCDYVYLPLKCGYVYLPLLSLFVGVKGSRHI